MPQKPLSKMTIAELRPIARQYGITNFSAIQRGARALNISIGAKYSPKQVFVSEIIARQYGMTTNAYREVTSVRGVRADVSYSSNEAAINEAGAYFLNQQFAVLANKQANIASLIHGKPGDMISPNGDVWHPSTDQNGKTTWTNTRTGAPADQPPSGSIEYSPQNAYNKIKQIVHKMNEKKKDPNIPPSSIYDDIEEL